MNAYIVLLTRIRQETVIVIPESDKTGHDLTLKHKLYNGVYRYLKKY